MRTLVIGDIHGGLKALIQVLDRASVTDADKLIFLGDYVDGWSESAQVIQYLITLSKTNSCVFIKGNHDVWCEQWLANGNVDEVWYMYGGKETIESYHTISENEKSDHLAFFRDMPLYHLDSDNRLFLHAGFTSMHGVEKENNTSILYTDRTLWEMALVMDENISKNSQIYPKRLKHYSEIYIGHTPTINFDKTKPMQAQNVWNVDTGAAFTGNLSVLDVDTRMLFQSDTLISLYPNEIGRNK